ncbi:hypothetical protein [Winogradskyella vincentii]|uniref:Uncharacterized protein n=1 Tax=Winogradskyella vincentii TaxID=2877122 RepID=A0ABS7Y5P1_9FLAO|nr:hypothetical protein [Winogradskyella vincentii]MCA0154003.1 hypothetical protein [Winogradskyella vincentii]
MKKSKIIIPLDFNKEDLATIFSYSEKRYIVKDGQGKDCQLTTLSSYIAHYFDQTLLRDHHKGAWSQVLLNNKGEYFLKMFCEHADLSPYEKLVPEMLKVAKIGVEIFKKEVVGDQVDCPVEFLLPFGLSMANTKSVQLLHYPPLESLVYLDYLYSPTNRRWENLLGFNAEHQNNFSELETIIDIVPLAAPGDDGKDLETYTHTFTDYIKAMLRIKLSSADNKTQPLVAYGGPVRSWLCGNDAYGDQINEDLKVLSLLNLNILEDGSITPVLCANHPSQYLYMTDQGSSQTKIDVMTQDLIVAGWQLEMSNNPHLNAKRVLKEMIKYWNNNLDKVKEIMDIQDKEYGYDGMQTEIDYYASQK